jgi:2-polyprenyl-3-methyl-5-hydroxy-6-metoxy-1,4-benzoquinol methylase
MAEKIEDIALEYHAAALPDMFIEEECQKFELDWILSNFPEKKVKVLDLGFGDGINFKAIAPLCDLTMVEGSELLCSKALQYVTEHRLGAKIVHSMFEDFQTTERFDVILASHVLEHVDDPIALLKLLQTLLRIDGKLVGIVPNSESFHRRLGLIMGLQTSLDELSPRDHLVGHQRVYSLARLKEDIQESGFELLAHRGFFLKVLANSQMTHLGVDVLRGLLKLSDELTTEMCANIGFVLTVNKDLILKSDHS